MPPLLAQLLNSRGSRSPRRRIVQTDDYAAVYAIGDVHGRLDLLLDLEDLIVGDAAETDGRKLIVMLGDYVDRGPQSAQVLDHLLAPPPNGFERVCLAGNHEEMMAEFLRRPTTDSDWLLYGGIDTLLSYGIAPDEVGLALQSRAGQRVLADIVPDEHRRLIASLAGMLTLPGYIFVHAGIRPGRALDAQIDEDLLWIRHEFITSSVDFGAVVVHGHTPTGTPQVRPNRIGIDTGAFATGVLTAAAVSRGNVRLLDVRGRAG